MTVNEYLASKMAELRARHGGISQYELAHRSGVPQPIIWRIEAGHQKRVDVKYVRRLAKSFSVSIDYLVGTNEVDVEDREGVGAA